jgi:hypothetical protein
MASLVLASIRQAVTARRTAILPAVDRFSTAQ